MPQYTASSPSTTSVVCTSSSQTPILPNSSPKKNYEAAFGQLSSQYGFAGGVPSVPTKVNAPSKNASSSASSSPPADLNRWEAAYGQLSSQYGFGGSPVPSLPSKRNSEQQKTSPTASNLVPSFLRRK